MDTYRLRARRDGDVQFGVGLKRFQRDRQPSVGSGLRIGARGDHYWSGQRRSLRKSRRTGKLEISVTQVDLLQRSLSLSRRAPFVSFVRIATNVL